VTAVCGPESLDLVRDLGADRAIDRSAEDVTRADASYDVVIDAMGTSTFGRCRHVLKPAAGTGRRVVFRSPGTIPR
jgi:NADPH:quinone reductase-like Zn-dependent oxidoreductase